MVSCFLPEGRRSHTPENWAFCASPAALRRAMEEEQVVEGLTLYCDAEHNLAVSLGKYVGIIPREETALGIADGSTREIAILSRVGKPTSVLVKGVEERDGQVILRLSRQAAQRKTLDFLLTHICPGDVLPATVTHLEPFGAFVDVGCGISSMIGIENISVSRIPHPAERFSVGQEIFAVVQDLDPSRERFYLSHKELLGTWEENVAQFSPGMTVAGTVRGVKEYGVFVELAPNLSGLAELRSDLMEGDRVSVYIKAILPERMKIKLLAIDRLPPIPTSPPELSYFIWEGHIEKWKYAPSGCTRIGAETIFSG